MLAKLRYFRETIDVRSVQEFLSRLRNEDAFLGIPSACLKYILYLSAMQRIDTNNKEANEMLYQVHFDGTVTVL